jgi:CRISPR-associated endonuclease/helicase Cas3
MAIDYGEVLQALAETKQMELGAVSRRYGEITLRVSREEETEQWLYHPMCVSRPLKEGASCCTAVVNK